MTVTWDRLGEIAGRLPGVVSATSYGEPSLKFRKHLLTRLRVADNSVVLLDVPPEERETLIAARPDIFFLEPHYQNYEIVLARLDHAEEADLTVFLTRRWRNLAPKRMVSAYDMQ